MLNNVLNSVLVAVLALSLTQTAVAAKPEGKGKDKSWKSEKQSRKEGREVEQPSALLAELTSAQRDELASLVLEREYGFTKDSVPAPSNGTAKQLPPGLQKKLARGGNLPPGWQKKLQRGEVMDRETYSQAESMPDELLRGVTGRDDAVELLRVGDRILRVMEGRGTILDVIDLSDRAIRILESN